MNDTAKNLAFLSRRVSALEKKVQSLEATLADNIVLNERLTEVVEKTINDLEFNTKLGHAMQKYFSEQHSFEQRYLMELAEFKDKVESVLPALIQHLENDLSIRT